ncbi:two-component system QseEF-associated lipoprotein QseG [Pantoea agglomerans]|uniref:YfhG lipoprotein n=1 Tax=Enterobacter agglomerans TaxID=549 RepID=A0ABD6XWW1_ENTAG|nr:two-component system QseEF-associated lipoprotein QseG [Pantoea agglomerans]KIC86641.1 membrane protein [Pantoea agglomerans]MBA5704039.1 two-component system QseEF-associated lipoprotein QseG [Pantoea agglomerans]MCH9407495.1 two-component system QseEF-associated lipoprotein QseG [Pantoea agglomerans]WNK31569.1 two-component system QseEF-associated lipoprotein QseG [Pantoea agglomerans]WNK54387.1 two-component system QseEF-associated lipoprotein QseG [Pantoea agglomerans]
MKYLPALLLSTLTTLLLSGCTTSPATSSLPSGHQVAEPEIRVADYLATRCSDLWTIENSAALSNPLYWMRAIDCAERLSPAEARAEAHRWPVESWSRAFKQGVLMSNGNVTPVERRRYVETLDRYSSDFPQSVRPLLQLWRSNQAAQLDLSEARTRYVHLQQSSDTQLEAIRQQMVKQQQQLSDTQHKLERLTDIERQLSSRKAPDVSDSSHGTALPQDEEQ